jgi:hypothetical protein
LPPYLETLHQMVGRWSHLGVSEFADGTRLVGHIPQKGSGAYLHRLFGPLQDDLIDSIEQRISQPVHRSLREFYHYHNGCILFSQAVFVYGLRSSYDRSDLDAMASSPFDIIVPAITHIAMSPSGRGTAVCKYEDSSIVFLEPDGAICRVLAGSYNKAVNRWSDLGSWLLSEFRRLEPFFDSTGVAMTPRIDTVPPYRTS